MGVLLDEVRGAGLERLDGGANGALAGQDDDRDLAAGLSDLAQSVHPAHLPLAEVQVQQDHG